MNKRVTLLFFDDGIPFAGRIKEYLGQRGIKVHLVRSVIAATSREMPGDIDICLIALHAPVSAGFVLAGKIQHHYPATPFIFLSVVDDIDTRLYAFEMGAEDFIPVPVSFEELYFRLMVPLKRRRIVSAQEQIQFESLTLIPSERRLTINGRDFQLRNKENQLLSVLLLNAGSYVPRSELLRKIWQSETLHAARSMDVFISRLRQILKAEPNVILENLYGSGFRIIATGKSDSGSQDPESP